MEKIIKVDGMSCEHCVKKITNAINEIEGAKCLNVSLEDGTVTVDAKEELLKQIEDTIVDLGYEISK